MFNVQGSRFKISKAIKPTSGNDRITGILTPMQSIEEFFD
jgi:hypothetical protein